MSAAIAIALLAAATPCRAQTQEPPAAEAADLPAAPIPYTAIAPKPRKPPPPSAPSAPQPASPSASASPAPTGAPALAARVLAGARLQPGQPLPAPELQAFVDGVVQQAMHRQHIAGASVAVVQNGQVVVKKGYGAASLSPYRRVDPDRTLFRLGSISKTFTWIAVMRQVEAGRMRLDQPVSNYLPQPLRVRQQGYSRPVRVIDLMSHAAGFEDRGYGELFERDPDHVRPLELYLHTERPLRVQPPGQSAIYSNYGAALAGAAVASTSKRPFERLMEEDLFSPLGMTHTTFREPRPPKAHLPAPMPAMLAGDLAQGYRWTAGGLEPGPYEFISHVAPAGSASSTAGDMARYMLTLLGGGRLDGAAIYGPQTSEAFRTPILQTPPGVNGWAHGFIVEQMPTGLSAFGHYGATLYFRANMVVVPELNLGVFVAANTDTGEALARDLPQAIVAAFYAPPAALPRPGVAALTREAWRFEGAYLGSRRARSGLEGFVQRLTAAASVRVTPQGGLLVAGSDGVRVWVPDGLPAHGRFVAMDGEERLAFRMVDGRGAAFIGAAGLQTFDRVEFRNTPGALGLMAVLAAGAALVTLAGAARRNRRETRDSLVQSRAALIQILQAALWLVSMASFGVWGVRALTDPSRLVFDWPSPLLITASACALVAAALTVTTMAALPAVWRGGRRADSWPVLRRLAFTITVAIYAVFSLLLASLGALSPWNG